MMPTEEEQHPVIGDQGQPPTTTNSARASETVGAINTGPPPRFDRSNPEVWFCQLEANFAASGIRADSTRYNIAVGALDSQTAADLLGLIRDPPAIDRYDTLKRLVLERYTDSTQRWLHKLFSGIECGSRKPSQLLRDMRLLAGDDVSEEALKVRWLDLLPLGVARTSSRRSRSGRRRSRRRGARNLHGGTTAALATTTRAIASRHNC